MNNFYIVRNKWIYSVKSEVGTKLWLLCTCGYSRKEKAKNLVLGDLNSRGKGSQTINKITN